MNPFKVGDRVLGPRTDEVGEIIALYSSTAWVLWDGSVDPLTTSLCYLREIPPTFTRWVNVYSNFGHNSREDADIAADYSTQRRVACVEITVTEGEGLDES